MQYLQDKLKSISGVELLFKGHAFNEVLVRLSKPVANLLEITATIGLQPGLPLATYYPELGQTLLICVTETKTEADIDQLVQWIAKVQQSGAHSPKVATENHP